MAVSALPTLKAMAEVYRLAREDGPSSPRFVAYRRLAEEGRPVWPYNPMANGALTTVEALLALGAEHLAAEAVADVAKCLGADEDLAVVVAVATPGMWTDRALSEAERRLAPREPARFVLVELWAGEPVSPETVRVEAGAQAVRFVRTACRGVPRTVADALDQEGTAYALAGLVPPPVEPAAEAAVREALAVVGEDDAFATMVAVLYGDEAAERAGFTPLGVPPGAGLAVAVADARARLAAGCTAR